MKGCDEMGRPKGGKNRRWTKEKKITIINRHLIDKIPLSVVAKEFNISHGMLSNWINKYLEYGEDALVATSGGNRFAALTTSKSLSEVERLRLVVAKQEIEIERLKKGYFVKGVGASKEYVTGKEKTTK